MSARTSSDDVISISSSSDSDSDCQIVRVIPSPAKRGKHESTRWESKPSTARTKRETAMTERNDRQMKIRQSEEADDQDRLGSQSALRAYGKWLNEDSMGRRRDGGCDGRLQDMRQRVLGDGHLAATGEDGQPSHQHAVDPRLSSISSPLLHQGVAFKREVRHQGDEDWSLRSRSCSTATLDFSPKMPAARLEDFTELARDGQENFSLLDPASGTTDFVDTSRCLALNPGDVSNSAYPTPSRETLVKEELNAEAARLARKRRSRPKCHANDDPSRWTNGSRQCIGSWTHAHKDRHQLPQKRRDLVWDSIVNVEAFNALPVPLFTRPKKMLREVTYDDVVKERAKRERRRGFRV